NEETLTKLQTFESVKEMNEAIKAHKEVHQLNATDRAILDAISRYACKYNGVNYLSKQGIAEAAGFKSRRTAIRSCKRLEALGITKQYETRRQGGDRRRSVDIIVIQPIKQAKPEKAEQVEQVTPESHAKETPYKANNSSNTYDTKTTREQVIHESITNNTP